MSNHENTPVIIDGWNDPSDPVDVVATPAGEPLAAGDTLINPDAGASELDDPTQNAGAAGGDGGDDGDDDDEEYEDDDDDDDVPAKPHNKLKTYLLMGLGLSVLFGGIGGMMVWKDGAANRARQAQPTQTQALRPMAEPKRDVQHKPVVQQIIESAPAAAQAAAPAVTPTVASAPVSSVAGTPSENAVAVVAPSPVAQAPAKSVTPALDRLQAQIGKEIDGLKAKTELLAGMAVKQDQAIQTLSKRVDTIEATNEQLAASVKASTGDGAQQVVLGKRIDEMAQTIERLHPKDDVKLSWREAEREAERARLAAEQAEREAQAKLVQQAAQEAAELARAKAKAAADEANAAAKRAREAQERLNTIAGNEVPTKSAHSAAAAKPTAASRTREVVKSAPVAKKPVASESVTDYVVVATYPSTTQPGLAPEKAWVTNGETLKQLKVGSSIAGAKVTRIDDVKVYTTRGVIQAQRP